MKRFDWRSLCYKLLHEQAVTRDELNRLRMRLNRGNAIKEWEHRLSTAQDIHKKCHYGDSNA
jgi:hypothetical protein